jgi:hypothetical protein
MMTDSKSCETAYDRTIAKLEVAGRTHDPVAMIALFSSDIIVRSPITQRIRFEGIEQATDLFHRVFKHISDIRFYKVIGAGSDEQVIFWRGRVGNVYLEEANLLKMNAEGQIAEMTVFMRAVPGLLALAAGLAPSLARSKGLWRGIFVGVQLKLILVIYRAAEPLVIKVAGAGVPINQYSAD